MILSAEEVCDSYTVGRRFYFISRFLITRKELHPRFFRYPKGHKHSVALGLQTPACMFSL